MLSRALRRDSYRPLLWRQVSTATAIPVPRDLSEKESTKSRPNRLAWTESQVQDLHHLLRERYQRPLPHEQPSDMESNRPARFLDWQDIGRQLGHSAQSCKYRWHLSMADSYYLLYSPSSYRSFISGPAGLLRHRPVANPSTQLASALRAQVRLLRSPEASEEDRLRVPPSTLGKRLDGRTWLRLPLETRLALCMPEVCLPRWCLIMLAKYSTHDPNRGDKRDPHIYHDSTKQKRLYRRLNNNSKNDVEKSVLCQQMGKSYVVTALALQSVFSAEQCEQMDRLPYGFANICQRHLFPHLEKSSISSVFRRMHHRMLSNRDHDELGQCLHRWWFGLDAQTAKEAAFRSDIDRLREVYAPVFERLKDVYAEYPKTVDNDSRKQQQGTKTDDEDGKNASASWSSATTEDALRQPRTHWLPLMDEHLLRLTSNEETFNGRPEQWTWIAQQVGAGPQACRRRWLSLRQQDERPWTLEEDLQLLQQFKLSASSSAATPQTHFEGDVFRVTGREISEVLRRFRLHVDPRPFKTHAEQKGGGWTASYERALIEACRAHGGDWDRVADRVYQEMGVKRFGSRSCQRKAMQLLFEGKQLKEEDLFLIDEPNLKQVESTGV